MPSFIKRFQYQVFGEPVTVPQFEDKWHQRWSEPVRPRFTPAMAVVAMSAGLFSPVITDEHCGFQFDAFQFDAFQVCTGTPTNSADQWVYSWSEPVRLNQFPAAKQQTLAFTLDSNTQITNTYESRWHQSWSEPVRFRYFSPSLQPFLQPTFVAPVAPPPQVVTSAVSSQVTFSQRFIYQTLAEPFVQTEVITVDKWFEPLSEPKRFKDGLAAHLQQPFTTDTAVIPTSQMMPWFESLTEPVRIKQGLPASEQQASAWNTFTPEFITVDKWFRSWQEPVRFKPQLPAGEQQFLALVIEPNQVTQNLESRWHYAWSEPVRLRQFPTAEQQSVAFQPPSFEIITEDKWNYSWSEPVRQRRINTAEIDSFFAPVTLVAGPSPGTGIGGIPSNISVNIQYNAQFQYQGTAAPVFTPAGAAPTGAIPSSISVGIYYEKRIQFQTRAAPVFVPESITIDKWAYAWSEPVRQKIGLGAYLQQAAALVLNPNTQITNLYESRWHYAWSEPIRLRQFPAAEQQALAFQPPSFEVITVDKWFEALSEPKRFKAGLAAYQQQAFTADTAVIPTSKLMPWFAPLNEPVRLRQFPVSEQQFIAQTVFVTEVITEDKWHQPWSEPNVKTKRGLGAQYQQAFTSDTAVIPLKRMVPWIYPWSEPSVKTKRGLGAQYQQAFTSDTSVIPLRRMTPWIYPWSEPLRRLPGLGAWLQQVTAPEVPPFPNFVTTINWFAPFNEPVRQKIGLGAWLQLFRATQFAELIPAPATVILLATETNNDIASFGIIEFLPICKAVVSVVEVKAINAGNVSIIAPDCINTT